MNTGLTSFADPLSIGPMYPFVGSEWLLVLILLVCWLVWQIAFLIAEDKEYKEAAKLYRERGLNQATSEEQEEHIADDVRATLHSHD